MKFILYFFLIIIFSLPALSQEKLKVGIGYFIEYENNEKNNTDIRESIYNNLNKTSNNKFSFQKIDYIKFSSIDTDYIKAIGFKKNLDLILAGTIFENNNLFWLNIRLIDIFSGNIIYTKQYFYSQENLNSLAEKVSIDLTRNYSDLQLKVINFNEGNASIRINSVPLESFVSIDGKQIGKTPLILKNISEKEHTVEVWRNREVTVKSLKITSNEKEKYSLKFENYEEKNLPFEINDFLVKKEEYKININSKSNRGNIKISVETEPKNLEIILNNRLIGYSPTEKNNIGLGTHKIKIKSKSINTLKKTVDSEKIKNAILQFNLFKQGRTLFTSMPIDANIYINNKLVGKTPKSVDLPIGEHKIKISKNAYKDIKKSIKVEEGKISKLNVELEKLKNQSTNLAFTPTAITNNKFNISGSISSLGQITENDKDKLGSLFGTEINYGFTDFYKTNKWFDFGVQFGLFLNFLSTFDNTEQTNSKFELQPGNYGLGSKLQIMRQNQSAPVSMAIGGYYNFNPETENNFTPYLAISREFGDYSFHLGLQTRAINFNINYDRFYNFKIGGVALVNFNLLTNENQFLTPLFGIDIGYTF